MAVQERDGAAQRLWARVDRSGGPNACWPWSGATSRGYGVLGVGSRSDGTRRLVKAHRLAYELEHGSPRSRADRSAHYGAVVRHRCHNPLCCNPAHLVAGTQEDNILDREVRAGRRSAADT